MGGGNMEETEVVAGLDTQPGPGLPQYERPEVEVMNDEEVLRAFQMTAAQISSAGCWWTPGASC
jgi:hypothetical protein